LVALVVLILFGIHFIPVVGGWIVAALILGLFGVLGFGALRQAQGRILPSGMNRFLGIFMGAVAGLMIFVVALFIISRFAGGLTSGGIGWLSPAWALLAGVLGLAASALALFLLNRYSGRSVAVRA
jgi:hypothetical protein